MGTHNLNPDDYVHLADGQVNESRVLIHDECPELLDEMLKQVPFEATGYKEAYVVYAPPGYQIQSHDHEEWVVLYYPEPANSPVVVADEEILPEKGEFLVIPPKVKHWVPMNKTDTVRVSIAMKVVEP